MVGVALPLQEVIDITSPDIIVLALAVCFVPIVPILPAKILSADIMITIAVFAPAGCVGIVDAIVGIVVPVVVVAVVLAIVGVVPAVVVVIAVIVVGVVVVVVVITVMVVAIIVVIVLSIVVVVSRTVLIPVLATIVSVCVGWEFAPVPLPSLLGWNKRAAVVRHTSQTHVTECKCG